MGLTNLMRTNDAVVLGLAESLLKDAGIHFFVADRSMSVMEGSLGVLPRRVMVDRERIGDARQLVTEAGVDADFTPDA